MNPMAKKSRKPSNKLETTEHIIAILAGIADIVYVIWQLFKD